MQFHIGDAATVGPERPDNAWRRGQVVDVFTSRDDVREYALVQFSPSNRMWYSTAYLLGDDAVITRTIGGRYPK